MKKAILLLGLCLGCSSLIWADEPAPQKTQPDAAGWENLFTDDLSNATFPEGVWTVKDGLLSATKDECIWTKKQYENFTLDFDFKTDKGSNSGVMIYCTDVNNWIPTEIEIQLLDDFSTDWTKTPESWKCGGIFGRLAPSKSMVKKPGEWNHITIECKGKNISVTLNGELITQMDMSKWTSATKNPDGSEIPNWINKQALAELPTKGHIGLQGKHAGVPTWFRNVKIKNKS
jgi:hypothetical protein